MTEQDKTLLQTIQARLEWNERGSVDWVADENGPWKIVPWVPKSGLTQYFIPTYQPGIDIYGQIKPDESLQNNKNGMK
jgi:hypothetical protein